MLSLGQCGGQGWNGPTTCAQGTCKYSNGTCFPQLVLPCSHPSSLVQSVSELEFESVKYTRYTIPDNRCYHKIKQSFAVPYTPAEYPTRAHASSVLRTWVRVCHRYLESKYLSPSIIYVLVLSSMQPAAHDVPWPPPRQGIPEITRAREGSMHQI